MKPILPLLAAFALAKTASAASGGVRYLDLVNTTKNSIISLSVTPAGRDRWTPIDLGPSLQGGGASITVAIDSATCLHDLRTVFANGIELTVREFDVCRRGTYRPEAYLRKARMQRT